jgi:hypothetical protein
MLPGLNHGIQIQNGLHKGRLALAERLDCPGVDETPAYWRSYVLYSDDEVRCCRGAMCCTATTNNAVQVGLR